MPTTLDELDILVLDGQTTGATPQHGRLLELAWRRVGAGPSGPLREFLLAPPTGESLSRRTIAITGITDADLADATPAADVHAALCADAASAGSAPVPCVVHFARFEATFLRALHEEHAPGEPLPLELICTHEIAMRVLPHLPRRGLRAVAGRLGHVLGELRRAGPHVRATALVWRELVALLRDQHGVHTLSELQTWLREVSPVRAAGREFAIDRATRLALPDAPGVYRFLGQGGEVLYLGKATSLRRRVNSYFQKHKHTRSRTLEMLTQAHDVVVQVEGSPLEAALRESDLIKEHEPPYNIALRDRGQSAAADALERLASLSRLLGVRPASVDAEALVTVLGFPGEAGEQVEILREGFGAFAGEHGIGAGDGDVSPGAIRGLGVRLWRRHLAELERRRAELVAARAAAAQEDPLDEGDVPDADERSDEEQQQDDAGWHLHHPHQVVRAMELVVREGARIHRRARWFRKLARSVLVWRPPHRSNRDRRMLVLDGGTIVCVRDLLATESVSWQLPESSSRPWSPDRATQDRLRVLTTELRRLAVDSNGETPDPGDSTLELWLAPGHRLDRDSLRKRLLWV